MKLLEELHTQGCLRPLDLHFANWLTTQQPNMPDFLVLLAALTSQQLGEGHVCIDLQQLDLLWADWPTSLREEAGRLRRKQSVAQLVDHLILGDGQAAALDKGSVVALDEAPVAAVDKRGVVTPLILDKGRLYLYRYWQYECQVAVDLLARATPADFSLPLLKEKLNVLFPTRAFPSSATEPDGQRIAAATAVMQSLAIISGGPGTGKTTTITRMLAIYLQMQHHQYPAKHPVIRLAAPTGKAAARLSESISAARDSLDVSDEIKEQIPDEGTTLHRLLGARPGQSGFKYNADNPLHLDLLVVDEASMIDLPLMASLLSALPPQARLILVGDKEQLASVEAGSVMGDLCALPKQARRSEKMTAFLQETCGLVEPLAFNSLPFADSVAFLTHSYRFSRDSGIGALARAVNNGSAEQVKTVLQSGYSDVQQLAVNASDNTQLIQHMLVKYRSYLDTVSMHAPPADILKQFSDFRVLCGLRKGIFGVEALNEAFEKEAESRHLIKMNGRWYPGRPVMITRNDRSLRLYNGDVGIALIDAQTQQLKVWFDQGGELVSYSTSRLPQHETVFAMTVHKSQGSEFNEVTLVLAEDAKVISRELVYTGITRAKKHCSLYGSFKTIVASIDKATIRMSGLAERIWGRG
ncbi:exodeoxyribonuclease V subunit alpha [Neptunomonas qingdaonensis]|uniref:RecBCD enzyme subunit RecD n=1 Tax=Neptunomonas qingdaonensis TaxID=1045558 RepID=A0A1I2SPE6_9GAMM|nr:exodeoxyribonuclease V subunit alpha [Neptunomonas qingdaonensis]SFG54433.1 DNA helicase/exodeoxyribonuclease V, alpha subunit [Neptunomonas qingdaonensis]